MGKSELDDFDPREAERAKKRDRKRKTTMVVDGGSMRKILLARQARAEEKAKGKRGEEGVRGLGE